MSISALYDPCPVYKSCLYLTDSYVTECDATVTNHIEEAPSEEKDKTKGEPSLSHWYEFDVTIFHPQGGGQMSDVGTANGHSVTAVRKVKRGERQNDFTVQHRIDSPSPLPLGSPLRLHIGAAQRYNSMRLHSAGHFLSHLLESKASHFFPAPLNVPIKGTSGHHFHGQSRVNFEIGGGADLQKMKEPIEKAIQWGVAKYVKQTADDSKDLHGEDDVFIHIEGKSSSPSVGSRSIEMMNGLVCDCGGTHISHLSELQDVILRKIDIDKKKNTIMVKYDVKMLSEAEAEEEMKKRKSKVKVVE